MRLRRHIPSAAIAFGILLAVAPLAAGQSPGTSSPATSSAGPEGEVTLTLLHNNDGESSLLPIAYAVGDAREIAVPLDIGGIAAFAAVTRREIDAARAAGNAVVNVYAGDAFLAGPVLSCSLPPQPADTPVFDALAQSLIPYDVHVFGNHEFDYGPDFLERFVRTFASPDGVADQPFLSATLDFTDEPGWADLLEPSGGIDGAPVEGRVVARSAIVRDQATGAAFGVVGATTWGPAHDLVTPPGAGQRGPGRPPWPPSRPRWMRSSPRASIGSSWPAISRTWTTTRHSWRACAGGHRGGRWRRRAAHRRRRGPDVQLLPGEAKDPAGSYPTIQQDLDGRAVPIVTTAGNYKYLGRLDVTFGADGEVVAVDPGLSYPRRVIPDIQAEGVLAELDITDAVTPDPTRWPRWCGPVDACLEHLRGDPVAASEVVLNVARGNHDPFALGVRCGETNGGNLVADSYLHAYDTYGPRRA